MNNTMTLEEALIRSICAEDSGSINDFLECLGYSNLDEAEGIALELANEAIDLDLRCQELMDYNIESNEFKELVKDFKKFFINLISAIILSGGVAYYLLMKKVELPESEIDNLFKRFKEKGYSFYIEGLEEEIKAKYKKDLKKSIELLKNFEF